MSWWLQVDSAMLAVCEFKGWVGESKLTTKRRRCCLATMQSTIVQHRGWALCGSDVQMCAWRLGMDGGAEIQMCAWRLGIDGGAEIQMCAWRLGTDGGAEIQMCAWRLGTDGGAEIQMCAWRLGINGGAKIQMCAWRLGIDGGAEIKNVCSMRLCIVVLDTQLCSAWKPGTAACQPQSKPSIQDSAWSGTKHA